MTRSFSLLAFVLVFQVACSTAKPVAEPVEVDPVTDPTIVGAVDEAVLQGTIEGAEAARQARRIGRVAGVLAAVFGGPSHENLDDTLDRYWRTREAVETTGALIGATKGAVAGAQRGYQLDLQFAELQKIEGLDVIRPFPDQIDVRFANEPNPQLLANIAAVFAGREERFIEIEAAGDAAMDIREALTDHGLSASSIEAHRNDDLEGVVLRIRYQS